MRGSCPCPSPDNRRYGGNTACVLLEALDEPPLILDLGTGLQNLAGSQPLDGSFRATALISHMHWDHVQGLPFFPPLDRPGAELDIYGPVQEGATLSQVFDGLVRPPYFPVHLGDLRGRIRYHDVRDEDMRIGSADVKVRPVPHIGPTVGYRVEWDGASVAYVSDHQEPTDRSSVAREVLELCEGVDLLIHDAQYTQPEFKEKSHWGHCTIEYALAVASRARARRLVLFHHDPSHGDKEMDEILEAARCIGGKAGLTEIHAAAEGSVIDLAGS